MVGKSKEVIDDMVQTLLVSKPEVFKFYFKDNKTSANLPADVVSTATESFKSLFPNDDLEDFLQEWVVYLYENPSTNNEQPESAICPDARGIWDPTKRHYMPSVLPPVKRRKKEAFDAYKFIMQKDENQEGCRLSFDVDVGEDLLDFHYEDKTRMNLLADIALRKMARQVVVMKDTCNYKMLDFHSERRIR